jgi:CO/xanthine dehydrogenase Mo-binding subunit
MERFVGRDLPRPDAPAKVAGSAVYVADLALPGAWVGGTVRSEVPCGELLGFDLDGAFDFGQVAVVRASDIPGENVVALIEDDQPLLAEREIRHFGEPLLLVAAPDHATLEEALEAILPRVAERAGQFDAERSTRVFKQLAIAKGDVEVAFARAAAEGWTLVEGTWRTDSQEQLYVEPQGCVAWPADEQGVVRVAGSLQCPHYVQKALARAFGIAPEHARVVQMETGGGFGGKEEYPSVVACHAALLARVAGVPVRMIYDRHEDLACTPKRHPSRVRHRTLVDREGRLVAMDVDVLLDGGAYVTLSPVVLSRGCIHAAGPYRCPNVRIRGRVVGTNHVPYGAFRGFGAPQTCFAVERQMDRVARAVGLHPAELRAKNLLEAGDTTATGQRLVASVGARAVLERALERTAFERHAWGSAHAPRGRKATGQGLSLFFHGAGFTGSGESHLRSRVALRALADGRVELAAGSTEIGQGTHALFLALAAEALGAELADVVLVAPDTALVPDSGPTVASRTCMIVGGLVARAAAELRGRIEAGAARGSAFRARCADFVARGGATGVEARYEPPTDLAWDDAACRGDAYPAYGWACDVAEVEVDLDTFEVTVTRFVTAVDVGRAIQPRLVEGQIEGGSLQAVGFAHLEVVGAQRGRFLQDRLATCIIPTALDAPPIEVLLLEIPNPRGPFGAKGVGELPMDGGAPAVVAAIEDALGVAPERIPATPERLLELWLVAHPPPHREERA